MCSRLEYFEKTAFTLSYLWPFPLLPHRHYVLACNCCLDICSTYTHLRIGQTSFCIGKWRESFGFMTHPLLRAKKLHAEIDCARAERFDQGNGDQTNGTMSVIASARNQFRVEKLYTHVYEKWECDKLQDEICTLRSRFCVCMAGYVNYFCVQYRKKERLPSFSL